MVSTRSKAGQTHIEDFAAQNGATKSKERNREAVQKQANESNTNKPVSKKRKSPVTASSQTPTSKRVKPTKSSAKEATQRENEHHSIIINRAPVLELWGACVTRFLYPQLPWETCISVGSAISTICAVAKGRSIGALSERDESEEKRKKREQAKKKQENLDEIEVMQFKLKLKDGLAIVGSEQNGKPGAEAPLKKKFGEGQYEDTRKMFDEALNSWEGKKEEMNMKAFGFYEEFRPNVKIGQKGWGRKGELNLDRVKSTIAR